MSEAPTPSLVARGLWLSKALLAHLTRHWFAWVMTAVAWGLFSANYTIGMNESPSLPGKVFLVQKDRLPKKGEMVSFWWQCEPKICSGKKAFTKIVRGVPGDRISAKGLEYFVNDESVGFAKLKGSTGRDLMPKKLLPEGYVLQAGEYFAWSPHEFSFDSRYEWVWVVKDSQIIGRTTSHF